MAKRNPADHASPLIPSGKDGKFGIVVSSWNQEITRTLLDGCRKTLLSHEVAEDHLRVIEVPGSFELPMGAKLLLSNEKFDAVICLGCVIKGETKHDEYISQAVANGIMQLSLISNTPVIFGVVTTNSLEQARARAGGDHGHKGIEAAETALSMAHLKKTAGKQPQKIGFS
jgi:6,7-dimethyl-8-ribityllumazine synthase